MSITSLIVLVYRFLFELLALALMCFGSIAIWLYATKIGMGAMLGFVWVVGFDLLVVVLTGVLAIQLDNNRLLRQLSDNGRDGFDRSGRGPKEAAPAFAKREPSFSNKTGS